MNHDSVETAAPPGSNCAGFAAIVVAAALISLMVILSAMSTSSRAYAAIAAPVNLGTGSNFAVMGGQTVTNTGPTVLNGDLGVSPGKGINGSLSRLVNGATHEADAVADNAQSDLTTAYNDAAGRASNVDLTGQDLGGRTLIPGVYTFSTSAQLTGPVTLDGQNNPDAVFIFQIGTTLTTASNSSVELTNGAEACNVFYQVGGTATLGANTDLSGSILALTSIMVNTGATVDGRALARNGSVTLDSNIFTTPICARASQTPTPTPTPTETATVTESTSPAESITVTKLATPSEWSAATESITVTELVTASASAEEYESTIESATAAAVAESDEGLADSGASGMTPLFLLAAALSVILSATMIAITHGASRPKRRH